MQASAHAVPVCKAQVDERLLGLRLKLEEKLHLAQAECPLDLQYHGSIACDGYEIQRVSFLSEPGVRITANLYIPEGQGPFPAVLNMHGHHRQGKIAAAVQARGHILALRGIVVLCVDAAGAGERAETIHEWSYHGAFKAGQMLLAGDSLLAQQIRDNRRALDLLSSLAFVDKERIGATGGSGGGNQTMWLTALDERVKAAVIVVSVGSFEAYVTERNCMCETLPGGLSLAEEWEVLSLAAPRPLLIINALHDMPAFGYGPMSATCRQLEEVYALHDARGKLDWRLIDMTHGYRTAPLQAMLGWMQHWLAGKPGTSPQPLPQWTALPEDELLCYPPEKRPEECRYPRLRQIRQSHHCDNQSAAATKSAKEKLAQMVGWVQPVAGDWLCKRTLADGAQAGAVFTPRSLPLAVAVSGSWQAAGSEVRLLLCPTGKHSAFVAQQWRLAGEAGVLAVAADLPGVGELAWEEHGVDGTRLHDTSRACLWLGYTLAAEWAEAIGALCLAIKQQAPQARIRIFAEHEMVFAALICRALLPAADFELVEFECPDSAATPSVTSMAWCVPGFVSWGDLPLLRQLAFA